MPSTSLAISVGGCDRRGVTPGFFLARLAWSAASSSLASSRVGAEPPSRAGTQNSPGRMRAVGVLQFGSFSLITLCGCAVIASASPTGSIGAHADQDLDPVRPEALQVLVQMRWDITVRG